MAKSSLPLIVWIKWSMKVALRTLQNVTYWLKVNHKDTRGTSLHVFFISKSVLHLIASLLRESVNFRLKVVKKLLTRLQVTLSCSWVPVINPFHATDLFWYPLKTSENQRLVMEQCLKMFSLRTSDLRKDKKTLSHKWWWIPYFFQALYGQCCWLNRKAFYMLFCK